MDTKWKFPTHNDSGQRSESDKQSVPLPVSASSSRQEESPHRRGRPGRHGFQAYIDHDRQVRVANLQSDAVSRPQYPTTTKNDVARDEFVTPYNHQVEGSSEVQNRATDHLTSQAGGASITRNLPAAVLGSQARDTSAVQRIEAAPGPRAVEESVLSNASQGPGRSLIWNASSSASNASGAGSVSQRNTVRPARKPVPELRHGTSSTRSVSTAQSHSKESLLSNSRLASTAGAENMQTLNEILKSSQISPQSKPLVTSKARSRPMLVKDHSIFEVKSSASDSDYASLSSTRKVACSDRQQQSVDAPDHQSAPALEQTGRFGTREGRDYLLYLAGQNYSQDLDQADGLSDRQVGNASRVRNVNAEYNAQTCPPQVPILTDSVGNSLGERSTVGNIVKHYERNTPYKSISTDEDGSTPSTSLLSVEPQALTEAKEQESAQQSSSESGRVQSSACRDVSEDNGGCSESLSKGGLPHSEAMVDLNSETNEVEMSTLMSLPHIKLTNASGPQAQGSISFVASEDSHHCSTTASSRVPLDQVVMSSMRRWSYMDSVGSLTGDEVTDILNSCEALPRDQSTNTIQRNLCRAPRYLSIPEHQAQDSPSLSCTMLAVPSEHRQQSSSAYSVASRSKDVTAEDYIGDATEWETVVDSHADFTHPRPGTPFNLGVKRCGDSIADVSDNGNLTDFDVESNINSRARVAIHPGNETYQGIYHQRFARRGNTPVLLPSFGEHKVNGYLSDSIRLQPVPNRFHSSPPLKQTHKNPFKSSPPENMTPQVKDSRGPNGFLPHSSSTAEDGCHKYDPMAALSTHATIGSSPVTMTMQYGTPSSIPSDSRMIEHNHVRADSPGQESSVLSMNHDLQPDSGLEPMIHDESGRGRLPQRPRAAYLKADYQSGPFFSPSHSKKARAAFKSEDSRGRPEIFRNNDPSSFMSITASGQDPHARPAVEDDFIYNTPYEIDRDQPWHVQYEQINRLRAERQASMQPPRGRATRLNKQPRLRSTSKPVYSGLQAMLQDMKSKRVLMWLCLLYPFSLFLLPAFAVGCLDYIIDRNTQGDIICFSKRFKVYSLWIALVYWISTFGLGIMIIVVANLKH